MPVSRAQTILSSVQTLLEHRLAIDRRERQMVKTLNGLLKKLGYQVVPTDSAKGPGRRRGRKRGRKPGRKRGRRARRMVAKRRGRKRGPGRPRRRGRRGRPAKAAAAAA